MKLCKLSCNFRIFVFRTVIPRGQSFKGDELNLKRGRVDRSNISTVSVLPRCEPWTARLTIDSTTGGDGMHLGQVGKSQFKISENVFMHPLSAKPGEQHRLSRHSFNLNFQTNIPSGFIVLSMLDLCGRMWIVQVRIWSGKNYLQCLPIRTCKESVHVAGCPKNYVTTIPNCLKGGNHPGSEMQPFRKTEIEYK